MVERHTEHNSTTGTRAAAPETSVLGNLCRVITSITWHPAEQAQIEGEGSLLCFFPENILVSVPRFTMGKSKAPGADG